jgi:uncharacterized RDD family membrane protein YckC
MTEQPPPPASGYNPGAPAATRPGELLDRFLARLIDSILLAVVNGIVVTAIIVGAVMGESANGFSGASTVLAGIVSSIITTAIYMAYFAYLESSRGQTVGKMVMKLRTLGPDGANPTLEQAVRRNIFMAFGLAGVIPVVGGLIGGLASLIGVIMIVIGINKDTVNRQAWHDHFAGGTRVVKVG